MIEVLLLGVAQASIIETQSVAEDALPQAVYQMISVAARDPEDAATLDAVIATAKRAYPGFETEIDGLVATLHTPQTEPALQLHPSVIQGTPPPRLSYFRDWRGRIQLDASATSGNTDTSALGLNLKMSRAEQGRVDRLEAYANSAENNGQTNRQRWGASFQVDANFTDTLHGYLRAAHDEDEFAGFDRRTFFGGGTGREFSDRDNLKIRADIGPGFQFLREAETGDSSGEWVLYSALDVDWLAAEDWSVEQDVRMTASAPSTSLVSISALNMAVSKAINTGVSYEYRFESNPPDEAENGDSILRFNVSYGF